ncbi:hypothetical protein C8Q76DRAFT_395496 [Earliella scabrosa]|nr:hypothetical protein C8Q76DRAFT_395496 [Earliella scabrosa]
MSELYQATFRWRHPDASNVIVTGTFDGWSCSHHLTKTPSGSFEGTVRIPWGDKISYKYIVDGRWTTTDDQPTEMDPMGNLNNVFRAPARPAPEPSPAPAPAPEPETKAETFPAKVEESTVGAANGILETAKQAAVRMVEALAPGTAETPAPTPATETPTTLPEPEPTPTPTPAPAPSEPEPATEVTSTAVLPSEPVPVAPVVPVPVLPLSTEPATDAVTAPVADVSETKPLETTIVEGSATAETAVAGTAPATVALEDKPSTHIPAPVNGTAEEKPATNGAAPAEEKPAAVNGTSNGSAESPKPATNGSSPDKAATVNGKAATPTKEKKMRFPSLSSRHSRGRSSVESGASELGEKDKAGDGKEANGKDTVSSRFVSTQRQKRRTSLFGKLKDVFSHSKNEASA